MISILLPVDGSEGSDRALRTVIKLYKRLAPVEIRLLPVEVSDGVPEHSPAGPMLPARDLRDAGQRALLADPGFILEPDFDRLAFGAVGELRGDSRGKVFLAHQVIEWVN